MENEELLCQAVETGRLALRMDDDDHHHDNRNNHSTRTRRRPHSQENNNINNHAIALFYHTNVTWWQDLRRQYGDTVLLLQSDAILCSRNQQQQSSSSSSSFMIPSSSSSWWQSITSLFLRSQKTSVAPAVAAHHYFWHDDDHGISFRSIHAIMTCLDHHYSHPQQVVNQHDDATKSYDRSMPLLLLFQHCLDPSFATTTTTTSTRATTVPGAVGTTKDGPSYWCFVDDIHGKRTCPFSISQPWLLQEQFPQAYQQLLNHYCPNDDDMEQLKQLQHTEPFVLITEPRCLASTPFVIQNALTKLPGTFKVVLLHSHYNDACVQRWIREHHDLHQAQAIGRLIARIDDEMTPFIEWVKYKPTSWNTRLYVNDTWWEDLWRYGDSVLTMQSDTIICSSDHTLVPWHTVNWLGGVSFAHNTIQPSPIKNVYHLNGGFSLRRMDWIIACIRSNRRGAMVEDSLFNSCDLGFTKILPNMTHNTAHDIRPATIVDAMAFASDCGHTMCVDWEDERICPYGVHKPWLVGEEHTKDYQELLDYCPEITTLRRLQHNESDAPPVS
jgi:hypothetical protein